MISNDNFYIERIIAHPNINSKYQQDREFLEKHRKQSSVSFDSANS